MYVLLKNKRSIWISILVIILLLSVSACKMFHSANGTPDGDLQEPTDVPGITEGVQTAPTGDALKVRGNVVNFRSAPDTSMDTNIIGQLVYEQKVTGLGTEGDFVRVYVADLDQYGYVHASLLVDEGEILYASIPKRTGQKVDADGNLVFEEDGVTPVMVTNNLVDVRLYAPTVEINLVFATEDNVLGEQVYARAVPLLQLGTVKKLQKAAEIFAEDGYTIVLYDAYRPLSVQKMLYAMMGGSSPYVANPYKNGSNHNRGAAVDISLRDANGELVEMPTPIMTLNEAARRDSEDWSETARANVDYLTSVMKKAGFVSISSEWWHYQDSRSSKYMTTDMDFSTIRMVPMDE